MRASFEPPNTEAAVRLRRTVRARVEQVFDAWLVPELLRRWMFGRGLGDEEIVHLHVDPRVGGRFSFLVRRQGIEFDHVGVYLEFDRPRRLAFTWNVGGDQGPGSRVEIDLTDEQGAVGIRLVHTLPAAVATYANRTQAGWMRMMAALATVVEPPPSEAPPHAPDGAREDDR